MSFEGTAFTTAQNWKQLLLVWNHITWCNDIQKILIRKGNGRTDTRKGNGRTDRYTVSCFSWFIFSHLPNIVFQSGTKKKKKKVTKQLSSTGFHYETGQTLIDKWRISGVKGAWSSDTAGLRMYSGRSVAEVKTGPSTKWGAWQFLSCPLFSGISL